ncbi:MotA/TolQ/ExbB proton channel family protein [uncultured Parasutterella sp.]|jgi:Biopolymer transport proteins|uniref:MotA/TolQ/ExbB proton channel family protein n=1 Tax=uncultured Parasutterella sp. TaxID=1263098 RepID=UPI0027295F3E|nr:MotA/TolQ/ExbB proton channel family protein [uncultured Parasutterella sp.]
MSLIYAGGWVMIPLLLISVIVLALIIDRSLTLIWNPMPDKTQREKIFEAVRSGNNAQAAEILRETDWLKSYANALQSEKKAALYEGYLTEAVTDIAAFLERRCALLATLGRVSPLLGLLGTIIGMIQTFAVVAQSRSGIDMELLADGIWQALITTATGLIIAILAILCYRVFLSIEAERLDFFNRLSNTAILLKESQD